MNIKNRRLRRKPFYNFSVMNSYDNGEVLIQQSLNTNEYVVQNSITDIPFEEYVISKSITAPILSYEENRDGFVSNEDFKNQHTIQFDLQPPVLESTKLINNDNDKLRILDNLYNPSDAINTNESNISVTPKLLQTNPSVNNSPSTIAPLNNTNTPTAVTASINEFESGLGLSETNTKTENGDDFINDMKAILNGEKVFNSNSKSMESKDGQSTNNQTSHHGIANTQQLENKHDIFDQIAQSLEYAKAYDLGSVDLEKRFTDFDKLNEVQNLATTKNDKNVNTQSITNKIETPKNIGSEDFLRDLSVITNQEGSKKIETKSEFENTTSINSILSEPQFIIEGIAVADAIQIGLGAAAIVQSQVSASQGSFSLNYDKAQRLLTNEARQLMPGAQATKSSFSRRLFLISSPRDLAPLATANVIIEWEGNAFGEISTAVIRRDLLTSSEWSHSSANITISKIDRIPNSNTDPRTWAIIFSYEGTYDPVGNGYYEFSGEFEINAFGGLKFNRHQVVARNMFGSIANPYDFVAKGIDNISTTPPIPTEQINYLRSRLP